MNAQHPLEFEPHVGGYDAKHCQTGSQKIEDEKGGEDEQLSDKGHYGSLAASMPRGNSLATRPTRPAAESLADFQ